MYRSILDIPFRAAERFPERVSHSYLAGKTKENRTFAQFAGLIRELTAGFQSLGISKGDHVGFFVNNRYEWIATDFALMALGAVSVPRGSDTAPAEVQFIYRHSDQRLLLYWRHLRLPCERADREGNNAKRSPQEALIHNRSNPHYIL